MDNLDGKTFVIKQCNRPYYLSNQTVMNNGSIISPNLTEDIGEALLLQQVHQSLMDCLRYSCTQLGFEIYEVTCKPILLNMIPRWDKPIQEDQDE